MKRILAYLLFAVFFAAGVVLLDQSAKPHGFGPPKLDVILGVICIVLMLVVFALIPSKPNSRKERR